MSRKYTQRKAVRPIGPSIAYIPLTKGKYSLIDIDDADELEQWRWMARLASRSKLPYARRFVREEGRQRWFSIHSHLMAPPPGFVVDHISGNTLDNRRSQLRLATQQQNTFNTKKRSTNRSGYKGVSWHMSLNRWRACIVVNGKQTVLGYFDDPREAHDAYVEASRKCHGEFFRAA